MTPLAQPGNPKPRMFRLPAAQALINRLGFNNDGLAAFVANVRRARFRAGGGILGLNIGKNAATPIERAADDYLIALAGVYPHADYVTVNISSPNTRQLRELQGDAALDALLAALCARRAELAVEHGRTRADVRQDRSRSRRRPGRCRRRDAAPPCDRRRHRHQHDAGARRRRRPAARRTRVGGLSGAPLAPPANRVIAQLRAALGSGFPIIGVGGVMSAADARAKRAAGADLVQIYTGFIYQGPTLVTAAARALANRDALTTR